MTTETLINNKYFKSKNIKVFPCTYRGYYILNSGQEYMFDPESRLNTEDNYTNIAGNSSGRNSYIVSYDSTNKLLKCVIGGYYFEVSNFEPSLLVDNTESPAKIKTLYINTKVIDIKSNTDSTLGNNDIDSARTTHVLASWEANNSSLDCQASEYEYYFTGILCADEEPTIFSSSLQVVTLDASGTAIINNEVLIPTLYHGSGVNTIRTEYEYLDSQNNVAYAKNIASGTNSIAVGKNTLASGENSLASGYYTEATNTNTAAFGKEAKATNEQAFAAGWETTASGIAAGAFGYTSTASGNYAFAEGNSTLARGIASHSEGNDTQASGNSSHSEGECTQASNTAAHAEGTETVASGHSSHAEGYSTTASGHNSHAEGDNTNAYGESSHAEGSYTITGNSTDGSKGKYSHAEGFKSQAEGLASHTEGNETKAVGDASHAEGFKSQAIGNYSHASGFETKTIGVASTAEGKETEATGDNSHAEGFKTKAKVINSHAEGDTTEASEEAAHAEGYNTKAAGKYSHSEGNTTRATGEASHAGGYNTSAIGARSFVHGSNNIASAINDFVIGEGNISHTSQGNQTVVGKFNAQTAGEFIVGNGTSDSVKSNSLVANNNVITINNTLKVLKPDTTEAVKIEPTKTVINTSEFTTLNSIINMSSEDVTFSVTDEAKVTAAKVISEATTSNKLKSGNSEINLTSNQASIAAKNIEIISQESGEFTIKSGATTKVKVSSTDTLVTNTNILLKADLLGVNLNNNNEIATTGGGLKYSKNNNEQVWTINGKSVVESQVKFNDNVILSKAKGTNASISYLETGDTVKTDLIVFNSSTKKGLGLQAPGSTKIAAGENSISAPKVWNNNNIELFADDNIKLTSNVKNATAKKSWEFKTDGSLICPTTGYIDSKIKFTTATNDPILSHEVDTNTFAKIYHSASNGFKIATTSNKIIVTKNGIKTTTIPVERLNNNINNITSTEGNTTVTRTEEVEVAKLILLDTDNSTTIPTLKTQNNATFNSGIACAGSININSGKIVLDSEYGKITAEGRITAKEYNAVSDARLKTNIKSFNSNGSILTLPTYYYNFKNNEEQLHIGCLAQDLQKLYPELVDTNDQGYLSIKETKLVYILLEEIKKLESRISELEGR